jgi:hypothetical protein
LAQIERLTLSFKYFKCGGFSDANDQNDFLTPKERRKADEQHYQKQIKENISSFMELREIEDDLQKLKRLFEEQSMVIRDMKSIYGRLQFSKAIGLSYLQEASTKLNDYLYRIEQMMKSAGRARDDVRRDANQILSVHGALTGCSWRSFEISMRPDFHVSKLICKRSNQRLS